ncbi:MULTISPECIES: DUF1127 domain-containing protein [unclassified Bradyrhizobium]|uniref:DUF1127 domain-containing protein n=1 Tax=unclassified Bradyrhizobium TaxID=2631580 RepID=UPI00291645AF|nr:MULTISPECIES: DUF1127 domain-containing protein [unclassified Bradyrhizobium]
MPSTTDDLRIRNIKERPPLPHLMRAQRLASQPRDLPRLSRPPVSATPGANVYPFVKTVSKPDRAPRETKSVVRVWWERWLERRRFARQLPWMADEVLKDYGLTREQARWLCRRPFWRA